MLSILVEASERKRADLLCLEALRSHPDSVLSQTSRALLKKHFQTGGVKAQVNGAPARSLQASDLLGPGRIEFELHHLEQLTQRTAAPAEPGFELPVLFENAHLLVLNKRSGVASVPHSPQEKDAAVNFALRLVPSLRDIGRGGLEPGILHRLDTGTSGALVFAKTDAAFSALQTAWKSRDVRKIYRALVRPEKSLASDTVPPSAGQELRWPIGHDLKSPKRMLAVVEPGRDLQRLREPPQSALSRIVNWTPIRDAQGLTDVCIEIETGVMHQIRVHLRTLGYPIQGDPIYGGTPSRRLWLHAWKLSVPALPGVTDEPLHFEAPLPEGWPPSPKEKAQ